LAIYRIERFNNLSPSIINTGQIKSNKNDYLNNQTSLEKILLEELRDQLRTRHYALRIEKTYISWVRRYSIFHNKRLPKDMGIPEIEAYLTYLATELRVATSNQNRHSHG